MTNELSQAASVLGRKGGLARSAAKTQAVRENGRRGGEMRHAQAEARKQAQPAPAQPQPQQEKGGE